MMVAAAPDEATAAAGGTDKAATENLRVAGLPQDYDSVEAFYDQTVTPPPSGEDPLDDLYAALGSDGLGAPAHGGWRPPPAPKYRPHHSSSDVAMAQVALADMSAKISDLEANLQTIDSTLTEVASAAENTSEDVSCVREELSEWMGGADGRAALLETRVETLANVLTEVLSAVKRLEAAGRPA